MTGKPNILIIMTDQQRADSMGCSGNPVVKTPNMDKIAREGVCFTRAYTVSPVCMPARASFISGIYPHNHDMWKNAGRLPKYDETFFHHLQKEGYFTAHVGKSHYYPHHSGEHLSRHEGYMHARGLDYVHETTGPWATLKTDSYMTDYWEKEGLLEFFRQDYAERKKTRGQPGTPEKADKVPVWASPLPEEKFLDSYVGQKTVQFIESYKNEKPLCLFVGFGGPHEPWDAPGVYASMYDPAGLPDPTPAGSPDSWVPPRVVERMRQEKLAENIPKEDIQKAAANYYGKISLIDDWVGRIVTLFEGLAGPDQTLVVFCSDHGEMLGDHQCLYKQLFYESCICVPLMIRWSPHIQKGRRCSSLVEIIDVYPTLLETIGSAPSKRCLGKSLWPLLLNPEKLHRHAVFSEISSFGHRNVMVRTQQFKYAVDETGRGYLLYNLMEDPLEQNNLIGSPEMDRIEQNLKDAILSFLIGKQSEL